MPKILKITNRYFLPMSAVFCLILLFLSLFWRNNENQKMMLSQGIVSKVNGESISEDTFQQYLSALVTIKNFRRNSEKLIELWFFR